MGLRSVCKSFRHSGHIIMHMYEMHARGGKLVASISVTCRRHVNSWLTLLCRWFQEQTTLLTS